MARMRPPIVPDEPSPVRGPRPSAYSSCTQGCPGCPAPRWSGPSVLDPETATLPILLMTGSGYENSVIQGLDARADDFVPKRVRLDELVARVNAHLCRRVAWSHVLEDELRTRASVVAALGHFTISSVPKEATEAVVRELAKRV